MDNIIQDFQERLKTQVPELNYIDEDWGQLDYYDKFPPVKFPCALIDIQSGQFTNDGELQQRGVLTVTVKLYIMRLSNTSMGAPQSQKDEAKRGWHIHKKVNQALHGQEFLQRGFGSPIRIGMQRIKRSDGIYQRDITYNIGLVDDSCVQVRKTTPLTATIRASLKTI